MENDGEADAAWACSDEVVGVAELQVAMRR
jgi:hypothetical protein